MLKIAITGNIASGKSVFEKFLKDKGFFVFDTDKIAHDILETSGDVKKTFSGYDVLTDGRIDRKKLGQIVFDDKKLLEKLESIVHPLVKNELETIFKKDMEIVFVSVPQLYETGFDTMFDKVILVTSKDETRLERLMKRNSLTKEEALVRINSQIPQEEKARLADYVLQNDSDIQSFYKSAECLCRRIGE